MTEMTSPQQRPGRHHGLSDASDGHDEMQARRAALRTRHARGLASLMSERAELRGVNALADAQAGSE